MPYYLSRYVGLGTEADPCRALGADEPGAAAIDLRADGGATPEGGGLNVCLLYLPTARSLVGLELLADETTERVALATVARLRSALGLPPLEAETFDALVLELMLQPPANGWKPLVAARRTDRFEVHLGPLTRTRRVLRGGAVASDTFNRANESPIGGNWTGVVGTSNLVAQAVSVAAGGTLAHVFWNPASFDTDQFSQAMMPGGALLSGGVVCRSDGTSPLTQYTAQVSAGSEQLYKVVSGTGTVIQAVTYTPVAGDLVRLEVEGSTLRYLVNGAVVTNGTATDTAIPSGGRVGLMATTPQTFDTWAGGDLASPPMAEAPVFVAAGALAANNTLASLAITAPTLVADDIMIACLINKALGNVISPPDGTWTEIIQDSTDCTLAADDHRFAVYWKRASSGDSGAPVTFTKDTDDNLLFAGVISAWRGCTPTGSPIDGGAATKTAAAADTVTFPAFAPTWPNETPVFLAFYGQDATAFAAAMSSDTNPDCTVRFDLENSSGTDCSIACTSGPLTGAPFVGIRTWASSAGTDSGNTGVVFGLVPVPVTAGAELEGAAQGTAATAATLTTLPALEGAAAGIGSLAGALTTTPLLVGASAGTGQLTATLTAPAAGAALQGTSTGQASLSAALVTLRLLVGQAAGSGSLAGSLTTAGAALQGAAAGQGVLIPTLSASLALAGATAATQAVTGVLSTGPIVLAGSPTGTASLTGILTAPSAGLQGSASGQGSLAATLTTATSLAGSSLGTGSLVAALTAPGAGAAALEGATSGQAILTPALLTSLALGGSTAVTQALAGALVTAPALAGLLTGTLQLSAALTTDGAILVGQATGTGSLTATLTAPGAGVVLDGAATGQGSLAASLTTALRLAGSTAGTGALTGSLTVLRPIAGIATGSGTLSAASLTTQSEAAGLVSGTAALAATLLLSQIRLAGMLSATGTLMATLTAIASEQDYNAALWAELQMTQPGTGSLTQRQPGTGTLTQRQPSFGTVAVLDED